MSELVSGLEKNGGREQSEALAVRDRVEIRVQDLVTRWNDPNAVRKRLAELINKPKVAANCLVLALQAHLSGPELVARLVTPTLRAAVCLTAALSPWW